MWEAVLKAQNYDSAIASATEKARASALNERIQNPKREFGGNMPPTLSGTSRGGGERLPKKKGGFAEWGLEDA